MSSAPDDPGNTRKKRRLANARAAGYTVGYCVPPQHTRFQKGNTARSGRNKGEREFGESKQAEAARLAEIYARVGAEKITITINGDRRTMMTDEAIAFVVRNNALKGDPRYVKLWYDLKEKLLQASRIDGQRDMTDYGQQVRDKLDALAKYHEERRRDGTFQDES